MSHPTDPLDTDARIDAIARAAGDQLRRPAPADGLNRARRAHRRRQTVRTALTSSAALAIVAVGVVALTGRDQSTRVVPAETTDSPSPTTSTPPDPTVTDPPSVGAPSVVYTLSGDPTDPDAVLVRVDPVTGEVVGSEPVDPDRALDAQNDLPGGSRSNVDLGDVAYEFDKVVFDGGTLDTERFPDVDLCGQNVVTVRSPSGSALPDRAHVVSVSPDDRYVVVLSSECPEPGTMGADGIGTQVPFSATLQVFDALRPDLPGRTLLSGVVALNVGEATFSGNGRFVALDTYDGGVQYPVFDLETGTGVEIADGCTVGGTTYSRLTGPWVGESSIAVVLSCADSQQLLVRDLMPGGDELSVTIPGADPNGVLARAEVDVASFVAPGSAWFVLCDGLQATCWVGQGDGELVELADVSDASFLPLGFYPGG